MKNKTSTKNSIILFFILIISLSFKPQNNKENQYFELNKIADENANCIFVLGSNSDEKLIEVKPEEHNAGIVIWQKGDSQDWSKGKYLVFEIYDENNFSGVINIEFYKEHQNSSPEKIILQSGEVDMEEKDKPWFSSLMGILPKLKTKVVFPLSYLDAQTLFVIRSPRQLKGTINGNRLDPNDITKVKLRFGPYFKPYYTPKFKISSIYISNTKPEPYAPTKTPIIDKFGQWKLKDWKGKIKSEEELISNGKKLKEITEKESLPNNWSKYGGWKEKHFNATGFFRTQYDGTRWWLADPDGYAFLSVGVDCFRKTSLGPVEGIEDLFDWLPNENDPEYSALSKDRNGKKSMDFYVANMVRVFGKDWINDWDTITSGL